MIEQERFGLTQRGEAVDRLILTNRNGARASVLTYGGTVTELWMPDRCGLLADVVLGFDSLEAYETRSPYFGCLVGRVAFRIAGGTFTLDGRTIELSKNRGGHHLHGGTRGFSWQVWQVESTMDDPPSVRFNLFSPAGDEGYPGNLGVAATYTLTADNTLRLEFEATTDAPTPVNLTHHGYFNLNGAGKAAVLDHVVEIDADRYCEGDAQAVPTGRLPAVAGTPWDFRAKPEPIGRRIAEVGGYDLGYLLRPEPGLRWAARVSSPISGRSLEVWTTEPALIFYTGNALDGTLCGKGGSVYGQYGGVCLETGRLPDSVHQPHFPSIMLEAGQTYRHVCEYRFSTVE